MGGDTSSEHWFWIFWYCLCSLAYHDPCCQGSSRVCSICWCFLFGFLIFPLNSFWSNFTWSGTPLKWCSYLVNQLKVRYYLYRHGSTEITWPCYAAACRTIHSDETEASNVTVAWARAESDQLTTTRSFLSVQLRRLSVDILYNFKTSSSRTQIRFS